MANLMIVFFILLLFLSIQQFRQTEQAQKAGRHNWFSNSRLSRGKWKWWRWFLIAGAAAVFIFSILIPISESLSFIHILSLLGILCLHQLGMRFINRLSSLWSRLSTEFVLIFILLSIFYLTTNSTPYQGVVAPNGDISLEKIPWQTVAQYIFLYSVSFMFVLHFIRYNLVLWRNEKLHKELKINRLKEELNTAQLEMLQARINPHFLYNSLNSIAGLALTDGENTRRMALSLSRFFSYCTDKNSSHLIPVSQELDIIKTYLDIEKIRFGERLEFQIIAKEETHHFLLPRMLLQPLVENSVKHGMGGTQERLCITILVHPEDEGIHIQIRDNGQPFPDDLIPGYGLKSIYDKLDILFSGSYEIALHNSPEKEISIRLMKKSTHEV